MARTGHRDQRVGHLILQELGQLLLRRVKDPSVGMVTLTDVEMSPDLTVAKVFYAVTDDRAERAQRGLDRAASFLRREVGASLKLKRTPTLRFLRDESIEEGSRIDSLLQELSSDEPAEEP